jgi:ubiquinone/menaquinone biosynthesis C-methylase UbiE
VAWFERFFAGLYGDALPATFDASETLEHARIVKRLLGLSAGQQVLDVPCGTGRIAIQLAALGVEVTGVDSAPGNLERARRDADRAGVRVRWKRCDMRKLDFDAELDAAFNWFGSFGYFSERQNLAFAKRVHRALRPGGRFLVEAINKPWLLGHHRPEWRETHGGVQIVSRFCWDARSSRMRDWWTLSKGERVERHRISVHLYSGPELRKLLLGAGFAAVALHGYPPVGKLGARSRRLIAVASKAG